MKYPYNILGKYNLLHPVLESKFSDVPHIFDFSFQNEALLEMDVCDQRLFQAYVDREFEKSGKSWGLAGYLERRDSLLRDLPQMVSEGRFFHLGLDIIVPSGSMLYAPLAGVVAENGYEEGKGNYGGYLILCHDLGDGPFYSLLGHLDSDSIPSEQSSVEAGELVGVVGDYSCNGDWFAHTHLQILTEEGFKQGYKSKGYCSQALLGEIDEYSPSPLFLFRYPESIPSRSYAKSSGSISSAS